MCFDKEVKIEKLPGTSVIMWTGERNLTKYEQDFEKFQLEET